MVSARQSAWPLVAAAGLAVLLAACNGQDPTFTPSEEDDEEVPAAYNEADVSFLQGMRPHHEEAMAMAELVPDRSDREKLNHLAQDIIGEQSTEVALFEELLAEAGVDPDTAPPHDLGGMIGEDTVEGLASLEGEEFERRFMELMIEHHQGAIDAAEDVMEEGINPRVAEVAENIRTAQTAEIEQLRQWMREWFGG